MADVGISYSHNTAELAAQVRREFIARGCTVWMDESDEEHDDAEDIGLPWGQAHWQVITDEFAGAGVVVVINDEHWQQSTYCRAELDFVNSWGKWVEFIDAPGSVVDPAILTSRIAAISQLIEQRRPVVGAHTRLVHAARQGPDQTRSRIERLMGRAAEHDARTVFAAATESSGLSVPEPLAAHGQAVLERARQARRTIRRAAIAGTAVLSILAIVGVVALVFARNSYRAAAASSARSQALDLASQAQIEPDTGRALSMAHRADGLAHSTTTTEAINVATANDARLRTIVVGPVEFYGSAWASGAPIIVGYSINTMVVIDTESRTEKKTLTVPDGVQIGTLAVSRDGATAVYATRGAHKLQRLDLTNGKSTDIGAPGVTAVSTSDGESLWWSDGSGNIYRSTFAALASGESPTTYSAQAPVMAIDVTKNASIVDYIDASGRLHTGTYDASTINEAEPLELMPPDTVSRGDSQLKATIKRCGENLYGSVAGSTLMNGVQFTRVGSNPPSTERHSRVDPVTPAVCNGDGTAWYGHLLGGHIRGNNAPYLPSGSLRYLPTADPTGQRHAVLTNDGKLYITADRWTRSFGADDVAALLPMATTEFSVKTNGDVVDATSGAVTGNVGQPIGQTAEVIGDDGLVVTLDGLAHIDSAGRSDRIDVKDVATLQHIRAGSDGRNFVVTFSRAIMVIRADGSRPVTLRVKDLAASEALADADISPDGRTIAFTTVSGRAGTAEIDAATHTLSTQRWWAHTMPAGRHTYVSYVPATGNLIVAGTDGDARMLDGNLETIRSSYVGFAVDRLATSGDWVLASSGQGISVYDARTLVVVDRIARTQIAASPADVRLDASRQKLVALKFQATQDEEQTIKFDIPLPGLAR